jgi:hypothetical protein
MPLPETGPYLKAALLCETVIEDKQGVLSFIRVVDRFTQTAIGPEAPSDMPPLEVSVNAVIMLVAGQAQGSQEVKLVLRKPSGLGQELGATTVLFEGEDRGANVIARLQLVLESQGLYWIEVSTEGQLLTKMPLRVVYGRMSAGRPAKEAP